jgi:hypothetical protein
MLAVKILKSLPHRSTCGPYPFRQKLFWRLFSVAAEAAAKSALPWPSTGTDRMSVAVALTRTLQEVYADACGS